MNFDPSQDMFSLYFRLRERTESPVIYHRWSLLTCIGAYLGRNYWFPFGSQRLFPNFYTMLIGHPGARKSAAIKAARKIISSAGYSTYSAEKTSKEKFLVDLEGAEDEEIAAALTKGTRGKNPAAGLTHEELTEVLFGKDAKEKIREPKEVFIVADEFNEFVGSGNLEFLSLLGMLWDWDDEELPYKFRLKNSKSVAIYQPTISILSGNTHAGFAEAFPPQSIGQGFLSRLLLVYGESSGKKITFPEDPDPILVKELVDRLLHIKKTVVGSASKTKDAHMALDMIYKTWVPLEDGRFKHYSERRFTHLLKLCLIVSAARASTIIDEQDVLTANTILTYTEADMPKALGEFGKSKDSETSGKIMQAIYDATNEGRMLTAVELMKVIRTDITKMTELGDILLKLQNAGMIQQQRNAEGAVCYLPKQKLVNSKLAYCDFSLLKEYQVKHGLPAGAGIRRVK